ncbi:hypothetical protein BDP27DRAFT_1503088 [Rhodocollybia butyracea]|uniref:Uncharacterized protein n=1 Tax=Rhodocollybia butyracea TaxID=206335 RepID=A0A9P5TYB3_9AGAR|nr:hypothetical protein BDP27DRAFT_1503088 [Rhodocollybia butyracea]
MLDFKGNNPIEGNSIQGYKANGTVAQQVSILNLHFAIAQIVCTGLSKGKAGLPVPTPSKLITVTAMAMVSSFRLAMRIVVVNRIDAGNNEYYKIGYTLGSDKLVLALPGSQTEVALANDAKNPRYQWTLKSVGQFAEVVNMVKLRETLILML